MGAARPLGHADRGDIGHVHAQPGAVQAARRDVGAAAPGIGEEGIYFERVSLANVNLPHLRKYSNYPVISLFHKPQKTYELYIWANME
jgi:hypothetical protein